MRRWMKLLVGVVVISFMAFMMLIPGARTRETVAGCPRGYGVPHDPRRHCLFSSASSRPAVSSARRGADRKSTRLNSSHGYISYAVFCLKKKKNKHHLHACVC